MTESPTSRLWNRNFLAYWLGQAANSLGDAFLLVALPFLVLQITGSATALATTVILGAAPRFLGPLTGALADRIHLRLPYLITGISRALLFTGLATLANLELLPIWVIYLAAPLNGLANSFSAASGMVLLPEIVPRTSLQRANSFMQSALMGVPLLGMGVAGALVGAIGPAATILFASPLLISLAVAALFIRFPDRTTSNVRFNLLADTGSAIRYLAKSGPLVFIPMLSVVLTSSLSLLDVTVPVTMLQIGRGAAGYGLFESMLSAGLLGGILLVTFFGQRLPPRIVIGLGVLLAAAGLGSMINGQYHSFLVGAVLLGIGIGASEVSAVTMLQLAIPDGLRGKVLGLLLTANAIGFSAGAWVAGWAVGAGLMGEAIFSASALVALLSVFWLLIQARGAAWLDELMAPPTSS